MAKVDLDSDDVLVAIMKAKEEIEKD